MTLDPGADAPGARVSEREILAERARALARPAVAFDEEDDRLVLLLFTVAAGVYALEIAGVREVLEDAEVSRLPWSPPAVEGVMNVRGEIVPVADTAQLLGLVGTRGVGPVIILHGVDHPVGLRVGAVDDVTVTTGAALMVPGRDTAEVTADLVVGLTASAVVLDADALCADPRLRTKPQEGA